MNRVKPNGRVLKRRIRNGTASQKEQLEWLCRPLTGYVKWRGRWLRLKWAFHTWLNVRVLAQEERHEDPEGGAREVSRLRKSLKVTPIQKTDAGA